MRKIIFMMSVSLDGYFEGPDRELDWQLVDEELATHFNQWLGPAGAFLDGRITWELMAGFWPTADAAPTAGGAPAPSPATAEFARIWRDKPKIVYSRTLATAAWNTSIAREVVPADIERLKQQPGGDLVVGGADLAATFIRHDLVDEYRIYVHPVILGQGRPVFPPPGPLVDLELVGTRTFGNGVVLLHYRRPA